MVLYDNESFFASKGNSVFSFFRIRLWRMDEKRTLLLRSDWVFYLFYCLLFVSLVGFFFGGGGRVVYNLQRNYLIDLFNKRLIKTLLGEVLAL